MGPTRLREWTLPSCRVQPERPGPLPPRTSSAPSSVPQYTWAVQFGKGVQVYSTLSQHQVAVDGGGGSVGGEGDGVGWGVGAGRGGNQARPHPTCPHLHPVHTAPRLV